MPDGDLVYEKPRTTGLCYVSFKDFGVTAHGAADMRFD
jgi:hypothetical protein